MSDRYPPDLDGHVNFSSLKHILRSPRHYQIATKSPRTEPTDDMIVGTLVHANVLDVPLDYVIRPQTGPEGDPWHGSKKWCKQWLAENEGALIISQQMADEIDALSSAVIEDESATRWLRNTTREQIRTGEIDGVPCKGIPDAHTGGNVIDLKTTRDASPEAFAREALNRHYDMQMEFYRHLLGIKADDFQGIWIAAEKETNVVACHVLGFSFQRSGAIKLDRAIRTLKECREKFGHESGDREWPGYATNTAIECPSWFKE